MIIGLAGLGSAIAVIDRSVLGVAGPNMQEDLGISPELFGLLLSAPFWSMALLQIPMGRAVDRYGPRIVYGAAGLCWFVFNSAVALTRGFASLLPLRILLGASTAPDQVACTKAVSQWFPKRERSFASTIYDTLGDTGSAVAFPLATVLIIGFGWRGAFVATGLIALAWAILWLTVYRTPQQFRRITKAELSYIEADSGADHQDSAKSGAWLHLFRYRTVWGLVIGYVCRGFAGWFFATWYPAFLVDRGYSLVAVGTVGALPAVIAIATSLLGGWFSDHLVRRGYSLTFARKLPIVSAMLLSAAMGLAALTSNQTVMLVLLIVSVAGSAIASGPLWAIPIELAPRPDLVASLGAIQNTGSLVGGVLSPIVFGLLIGATGSFVLPMLIAAGIAVLGALVYLLVVGEIKPLPDRA